MAQVPTAAYPAGIAVSVPVDDHVVSETIKAIHSARNIPVLVCSMHEAPGYVRQALAAGARAYITKREAPRDVARAVRDVLEGWMLISPRSAEGLW